MKTKKLICIVSVTVIMLAIAATAMTGCTTKLSGDEAYDILMEALDLSLTGDMYGPAYDPETSETNGYIFAYKEAVRSGDVITNTNVNVHCDQDASYNLHVDEDLMVDLYQETWNVNAVTGGAGSKIGDFGFIVGPYPDADSNVERIYYTENSSDGSGKYGNVKVYDEMTAEDFIASEYFRRYSLAARLEELRQMPRDAFVFDDENVDADLGAYQQINLVKITFTVSQEYIDSYYAATGKQSVFAGSSYAEIELTFGRFSNIYVYRQEDLGGSFFNLPQEIYSLQVTYLGKNVAFPGGHDGKNDDGSLIYPLCEGLLERTDLAFAKAVV